MLDRSIPFHNIIMRCRQYKDKDICMPDGYKITPYCCGDEKGWARLEYAVGDFDSVQEAEKYFVNTYLNNGDTQDIFFLKDISENVIGSCIAWTDQRGGISRKFVALADCGRRKQKTWIWTCVM